MNMHVATGDCGVYEAGTDFYAQAVWVSGFDPLSFLVGALFAGLVGLTLMAVRDGVRAYRGTLPR